MNTGAKIRKINKILLIVKNRFIHFSYFFGGVLIMTIILDTI